MNDADLRQRFDALTATVPAQPQAYELVRARAGRIRRRRSSKGVAALVLVVAAAVALPETLQHQGKSRSSSVGGLSATCDPAAAAASAQYGTVERMYGKVTTAAALAAWRVHIGGVGAVLPPTTPVPLCLLVGNLDRSPAGPGGHYVLLSVERGAVQWIYTAPLLLKGDPMPGVSRSQITPWSGPTATPPPVAATTASAAPLTAVPPPSPKAASSVAPVVPHCSSRDLVGVLRDVGLVDGLVQAGIEISTTSPAGCALRGNLQLQPLTSTGAALPVPAGGLPGPTHGVYAPLLVDVVLGAAAEGHSLPEQNAGQILAVSVGDDAGAACAAKDRQTRPADFRVTIGAAVVLVKNLAASSDAGEKSLVGCPGRFYAGDATLQ